MLLTCGCQQASAKPGIQELVNVTFVQMFTAPKYHLKEQTGSAVSLMYGNINSSISDRMSTVLNGRTGFV